METAAILTALAELAPAGRDRVLDVTGGRTPLWSPDPDRPPRTKATERLAAVDVLHRDERILRRGWAFVIGVTETDGGSRTVRLPLLSEPVRLRRRPRGYTVVAAGDLELTPLVEDQGLAATLESAGGVGTAAWLADPATGDWIREAARAAGLAVTEVWPCGQRPPRPPDDALLAVAHAALYVARDVFSGSVRDTLLSWANRPGVADTALAAAYGVAGPAVTARPTDPADGEVLSPLPLTVAQREVVRRARTERVTVVSGPPGNGKSHAVVAAALEVVDRGGSVLVATQSSHAAEVLGELLDRYPGPTPVLFGDAERRGAIAGELAGGTDAGFGEAAVRRGRDEVAAAAARVRHLSAAAESALNLERLAAGLPGWEPLLSALAADAPGAFSPAVDLNTAAALADRAQAPAAGWWRRVGGRLAHRRLRRLLGAHDAVPVDRLRAAIEAGLASRAAARLAATGGTDLAPVWAALGEAEEALAEAVGTAMLRRSRSAARWDESGRRSAAGLAGALRAGRNRRRQLLAGMDGDALVRALPLWIGTAADTEDLLPPVPGLFDLVILDEASHLDQLRSAPVLARARRALVVGDPRQLRFVSFVADVDVVATLHRHGLDDRVDVRRVSAFDLCAGAAPVTWLDEHFRCAPHLIEFSATRFYGGRISIATRHPRNDSLDVIDVVQVPDRGVTRGVAQAEVDAVVATVRDLAARGTPTSIGVVTPFRAQADALESALVAAFPVTELERLGLRVGTVHAFQGSEADTVVASLGLAEGDSATRTRFVADPHLFNVLVTRARSRMIVVTSLTNADGVVGEYLAASVAGPLAPAGAEPGPDWAGRLATELRRGGAAVRADYPVGNWTVDLCVGDGAGASGLVCRVHPDGVAAHVERQRALARNGWRLVDAFASRWAGDPVRAALDLATAYGTAAMSES